MLCNWSGQNEVTTPPTMCGHDQTVCDNNAAGSLCVDGTCKNGVYDFWTILPRHEGDITVK